MTRHLVDVELFLQLDAGGLSAAVIADRMKTTPRTVQRLRARTGRARPSAAVMPQSAREVAAKVIEDGGSVAEAARTVGASSTTVYRWFPDAPRFTPAMAGHVSVLARRMAALG